MDTREERARDVRNPKWYMHTYLLSMYLNCFFPSSSCLSPSGLYCEQCVQVFVERWDLSLRWGPHHLPVRHGFWWSATLLWPWSLQVHERCWRGVRRIVSTICHNFSFYFWWLCSWTWTALWFGPPYRTIIGTQTRFKVRHLLLIKTHSSHHSSGGRLHLRLWLGRLCMCTSNLSHGERSYFAHICIR